MLPSSTVIFSPSIARQAASTSRDWSLVDAWLANKFGARGIPQYERNAQTLQELLRIVSLNEAADEKREKLTSAVAQIMESTMVAQQSSLSTGIDWQQKLLDSLTGQLSLEGATALQTLTDVAVQLGQTGFDGSCRTVGSMIAQRESSHDGEQALARIHVLKARLESEQDRVSALVSQLSGPLYRASDHIAENNVGLQRQIRAASAKNDQRNEERAPLVDVPISVVTVREQACLARRTMLDELESCLAPFSGAPTHPDDTRTELHGLAHTLHSLTQQRDALLQARAQHGASNR